MENREKRDRVIGLIHLYFGRKLWDLRGSRPLQVHERLLEIPDEFRRSELDNAFLQYVEEAGSVIKEAAREYREIAPGFLNEERDEIFSLIEDKLQVLVSDTENHVRCWLFGACGESLTKKTLDMIIHHRKNREELAAQWAAPDWLLIPKSRKAFSKESEVDEGTFRMLATDELQKQMQERVSLRLGAGVVADEMLLIKARFLSMYGEPVDDEEDQEQRNRDDKPLTTRQALIIDAVKNLQKDGSNPDFPKSESICKEIDRLRKADSKLEAILAPSSRWFACKDADQDPLPEAQRTWRAAYHGEHRTAVVNAIKRAWFKRACRTS